MNKVTYKIIFLLSLVQTGTAFAQWASLGSGSGYSLLYMPEKISINNGLAYLSILKNYDNSQRLKTSDGSNIMYLSEDATVIINCTNKTYSIPDNSYYSSLNKKGNAVHFVSTPPDRLKWMPVDGDAMAQKLLDKVKGGCS
jgi:hypothetical protein